MDRAWAGHGEVAIDTHTHLGSPLSCAAALAVLDVLEEERPARARRRPGRAGARRAARRARRAGLGLGLPCDAVQACERLLELGVIAVPAGMDAEVLELSPPLTISEEELDQGIAAVLEAVS